jgi:cytidine deaminase
VQHVVGHNGESCSLANSCCAERAAFLQVALQALAFSPSVNC